MARATVSDRTTIEYVTGNTPDISEWIDFPIYGWCKYWTPREGEKLGRWLGVAENIGSPMTYFILTDNMTVIACSSVRNIDDDEWKSPVEIEARSKFTKDVEAKLGQFDENLIHQTPVDEMEEPLFEGSRDDEEGDTDLLDPKRDDIAAGPDELTGAKLALPHGDHTELATVLG
jgi:hypothetical protein